MHHRVPQQLHPLVPLLEVCKAEQEPLARLCPRTGPLDTPPQRMEGCVEDTCAAALGGVTMEAEQKPSAQAPLDAAVPAALGTSGADGAAPASGGRHAPRGVWLFGGRHAPPGPPLGCHLNTGFVERITRAIRPQVAAVGRRVSTLCKGAEGWRQQRALCHVSRHVVLPPVSWRQPQLEPTNGTGSATRWQPCTPTRAAGLTDPVWPRRKVLLFRVPPWAQPVEG